MAKMMIYLTRLVPRSIVVVDHTTKRNRAVDDAENDHIKSKGRKTTAMVAVKSIEARKQLVTYSKLIRRLASGTSETENKRENGEG